jgi:hypothetical protein
MNALWLEMLTILLLEVLGEEFGPSCCATATTKVLVSKYKIIACRTERSVIVLSSAIFRPSYMYLHVICLASYFCLSINEKLSTFNKFILISIFLSHLL